jgi:hypothetical protein
MSNNPSFSGVGPASARIPATLDDVMRRIKVLSRMSPEAIVALASEEPPSALLDLPVEKRDSDHLLQTWESVTPASSLPLTERQYSAFLRGEEIPIVSDPAPADAANNATSDGKRLLAYLALCCLTAAGIAAVWIAFLIIRRHLMAGDGPFWILIPTLCAAVLEAINLRTQFKVVRLLSSRPGVAKQ